VAGDEAVTAPHEGMPCARLNAGISGGARFWVYQQAQHAWLAGWLAGSCAWHAES
jgi:hypothetical protein